MREYIPAENGDIIDEVNCFSSVQIVLHGSTTSVRVVGGGSNIKK